MIDIISSKNGQDIGILDNQSPKASNILSVQLGSLEYAPNLGIDLNYFLSDQFVFQNESFKAYLIEVLATNSINVAEVKDAVFNLFHRYSINLKASENNTGLIVR